MIYQSPIVIYDGNAVACIECKPGNYRDFRHRWRLKYESNRRAVEEACDELGNVKKFSLAAGLSDSEFRQTVLSKWFRERVFDRYLWLKAEPMGEMGELQ
jgi:hypothetical protein